MIYALLDQSQEIRQPHLAAALAAWRYCEESATFIFGDRLGDPTADDILHLLRSSSTGVTRNQIMDLFQRNKSSAEINRALSVLQSLGLARSDRTSTGGRNAEVWVATTKYELNEINEKG
jgi:hypothetical protein